MPTPSFSLSDPRACRGYNEHERQFRCIVIAPQCKVSSYTRLWIAAIIAAHWRTFLLITASTWRTGKWLLLHECYQSAESRFSHVELPGETTNPQAHVEHLVDHAACILNVEN